MKTANMLNNIGLIVGVAGGLIGGLIGIAAVSFVSPILGVIMFFVIIIFLLPFYFILIKPVMVAQKLAKSGKDGVATILKVWDTGITMNENPRVGMLLNVKPADGSSEFQRETSVLVSRINPGVYQPGMQVYVKYDPNGKQITLTDGPSTASTTNNVDQKRMEQDLVDNDKRIREIIASGISAKAIVLGYKELGINVNGNNPAVQLDVQVMPSDGQPFKAQTKGIIKEESVPKFQPGKEISVKYDRNDKTRVAVEHS